MPRYFLKIEYDGTNFCGWQEQVNQKHIPYKPSVQNELQKAAVLLTGKNIIFYGSGRTDAGVHATGQVCHIDLERENKSIVPGMNFYLRTHPIVILSANQVPDTKHARFSALQRKYQYIILNRKSPPAIEINRLWWIYKEMDMEKMTTTANLFLGTHDFSNFRHAECQAKSPIKTIDEISISKTGDVITIDIASKSFLHRQVRMIAGALVKVATNEWQEQKIKDLLALQCTKMALTAPAHGLYFKEVIY